MKTQNDLPVRVQSEGRGCCTYVTLSPEQKAYYDTRTKTRWSLDVRGMELTVLHNEKWSRPFRIVEIEKGLEHWWSEMQDQPDEIIVDSVEDYNRKMNIDFYKSSCKWVQCVSFYFSIYSINPNPNPNCCGFSIPVFESI